LHANSGLAFLNALFVVVSVLNGGRKLRLPIFYANARQWMAKTQAAGN